MVLSTDLHLILEAHVVLNVLARHADVVGDLVGFIALLGTGEDAGAAQAMNGRMVGVVGVDSRATIAKIAKRAKQAA